LLDLGLKKGRSKFLNFSDTPTLEKNTLVFYAFHAIPAPLDHVIGVYLVKVILLLIGQISRTLLLIGWTNLLLLRPAASRSTYIIG
jgi:hypothetical protein